LAGILLINDYKIEKYQMMMKKKSHEHEENKYKNDHNSTDNKENTDKVNNNAPADSSASDTDTVTSEAKSSVNNVAEIRVVEEKLAEMQDKYMRLSAEFDNYRKRTLREKMEMTKYAGEDFLLKIIPIMDDFERALAHMDSATDSNAMKSGIDLIYSKFSEFLKQNGIKEIESMNNNFNVDLHEAVAKVQVQENDKKGKVVDVVQKGYYLQDKVLRFSKVVVGE
jgi:molecular chaperone GrpE